MANWSDTYIEISSSNLDNLNKAIELINKYTEKQGDNLVLVFDKEEIYKDFPEYEDMLNKLDESEFGSGFSSMYYCMYWDGNKLIISGQGRWCSPYLFFRLFAEKYKLDMIYFDAEPGNYFSYLLIIKNGKIVEEKDDVYYTKELVKYIYGNDINEFLNSIDWYFDESEEPNEDLDNLLREYGISREDMMRNNK